MIKDVFFQVDVITWFGIDGKANVFNWFQVWMLLPDVVCKHAVLLHRCYNATVLSIQ